MSDIIDLKKKIKDVENLKKLVNLAETEFKKKFNKLEITDLINFINQLNFTKIYNKDIDIVNSDIVSTYKKIVMKPKNFDLQEYFKQQINEKSNINLKKYESFQNKESLENPNDSELVRTLIQMMPNLNTETDKINFTKILNYESLLRDSNILLEESSDTLQARLIDWGLSTDYVPFENNPFPKTWRNRPFQFNFPFSVVIFSDSFVEKYTKYLKDGGLTEEVQLKPFVIDYINFWMKERGAGHYKFINEIMFTLFSNSLTSISEGSKPQVIETQITMDYIVNYIVDVLVHFTRFRDDETLNLREYLDTVFIQIVDVWGFISTYYPMIELLANSYSKLSKQELKIFNQIQFIFVEYLYNPRHEPIDMNMLYSDLKDLGNLIHIKIRGKKKTTSLSKSLTKSLSKSLTKSSAKSDKASGINNKTRKYRGERTSISFKRKPPPKRFKNPVFLSIK